MDDIDKKILSALEVKDGKLRMIDLANYLHQIGL